MRGGGRLAAEQQVGMKKYKVPGGRMPCVFEIPVAKEPGEAVAAEGGGRRTVYISKKISRKL